MVNIGVRLATIFEHRSVAIEFMVTCESDNETAINAEAEAKAFAFAETFLPKGTELTVEDMWDMEG